MKQLEKHKIYYFCLVLILASGLLLVRLAPNKQIQSVFVVMIALFYFLFGSLHHIKNHDFRAKVVIEYALIASLGIASILFLLKVG